MKFKVVYQYNGGLGMARSYIIYQRHTYQLLQLPRYVRASSAMQCIPGNV